MCIRYLSYYEKLSSYLKAWLGGHVIGLKTIDVNYTAGTGDDPQMSNHIWNEEKRKECGKGWWTNCYTTFD